MKIKLIIIALLVAAGCKKSDYHSNVHVYVCGISYDHPPAIAKYWVDGQPVDLPGDGSMLNAMTTGIAVSGADIYVAGSSGSGIGYWKNGSLVPLGDGIHTSYPSCITVSGNDVYVGGSFGQQAAYWKNGQLVALTDSIDNAFVFSIIVSGSDVYAAGFIDNYAAYWKNGEEFKLTDGAYPSWAKSIAVSGNDVYVAGQEPDNAGYTTKYWKNGQPQNLNISDTKYLQGNYPVFIAVSGNDVHIVQTVSVLSANPAHGNNSFIMYWKNGQTYKLTDARTNVAASGMAVSGNDIYISGNEYNGSKYTPKYWQNGVPVTLNGGISADGIAIVPK